jgi:lysophospholipase L1-like esterase
MNTKSVITDLSILVLLGALPLYGTLADGQKILIDFSDVSGIASSGLGNTWNCNTGTASMVDMKDTSNAATTVDFTITTGNFGENGGSAAGGLTNPVQNLLGDFAVASATADYFYSTNLTFKISGLDTNKQYNFSFFAVRAATDARITRYTVTDGIGSSYQDLLISTTNASSDRVYTGNDDTVIKFANLTANASGEIYVNLSIVQGANAYIGAMGVEVVTKPVGPYTLTGSAGPHGTISPTSTNVPSGSSVNFTITADSNYRIASLIVNGTPMAGMSFNNKSATTNFTWSNVQAAGVLAATFTVQTVGNLTVHGSSVAKGYGYNGWCSLTNGSYTLGYAGQLTALLAAGGWAVTNTSTPGDTTAGANTKFTNVVATVPNIVLLGLGLGNEGLVASVRPGATLESFKSGMLSLIQKCRDNGYYPVVALNYPNNGYTARHYEIVKEMNLIMNTWDIPSFNFLGAIDNGAGRWADGFWYDSLHPNAAGHSELLYAIPPSLFDAIQAGKTNSPSLNGTAGSVRLTADASHPAPLTFTPSNTIHSFTTAFRVRTTSTGTVAVVMTATSAAPSTIEIRTNALVYVAPDGVEISYAIDAAGGGWIDVALAHRYAQQQTLLYVDGVLAGTKTERMAPSQFVLGGPATSGRSSAPAQADYQDWCVYRAAWHADEALAQHQGAFQKASLEICAPLNDIYFEQSVAVSNRAQSLSYALVNTTNLSAQPAVTPPGSLTAASYSDTSVQLSWVDNSSTETGYVIQRRVTGAGQAWSTVATPALAATSYADSGLTTKTTYDYRVCSQDGSLQSDWSAIVFVTTGANSTSRSFVDWRNGFFPPPPGSYLIDFNTSASPAYGGTIWNTVTSLTSVAAYSLVDTNNDSYAGYTLTLTDAFDTFNSGNSAPLGDYAADAQSTMFVSTTSNGAGQIALAGLNDTYNYDLTLFGRRGSRTAGYDYRTRYYIADGEVDVTFEVDTANNTAATRIYGVRPNNGKITIDVIGPDSPTGTVFAGISLLAFEATPPQNTFLVDFNDQPASYPANQSWNTVTSATVISSLSLKDASGSIGKGYTLNITDAFDSSRGGNSGALGGFAPAAEANLFNLQDAVTAQMTFGVLNTNLTYNFTFLARRGSVVAGYDYTGRYIFSGAGGAVTSIVNAATNLNYTSVKGIRPDSSGNIVLHIDRPADLPGTIEFPVINLIRMTQAGTGGAVTTGLLDDPDGDGIVNLMEYAYNMNPAVADTARVGFEPALTAVSASAASVRYTRYKPAKDIAYTLLGRTNLLTGSWQTATGLTTTVISDDGTNQTLRVNRPPSERALFLRLKMEYVP